jgi:branched-chain amino acid transport system ATP-binding protein
MLETKGLTVAFGGLVAVNQVDLSVSPGEILGMIGPNGAGKTTFFNLLTGFLTPTSGRILFKGKDIAGLLRVSSGSILFQGERIDHLPPHKIIREGITQVMEGRRLFPDLDVLENLRLGAYLTDDRQVIQQRMDRVFGYFPILKERQKQLASTFSGGEQQMLAMGRGLMASPNLLMLDEPSLGLAPILVQEVGKIIRTINRDGVTLLLIEQNAQMALRLANRGYVTEAGSIALEGTSQELISNDKVRKAYMGL